MFTCLLLVRGNHYGLALQTYFQDLKGQHSTNNFDLALTSFRAYCFAHISVSNQMKFISMRARNGNKGKFTLKAL